ncbi:MAG: Rieske 2Fe-2S domain-containing protein, partial [Bryobacterales bacterium]|nr:Rieske 2Fe-2S domain-containing protein [Bryobacterales bacterium]
MGERQLQGDDGSSLSPFPEGWYFVATRESILKARLIQKTWLGANIVAWCDEGGRICVAEAVCPHLGADLGPAAGGEVRDGCLVCPFHGFEYDITGQCVATPSAPAPKAAKLRVFETRAVLGMVFAWWGIGGRPPQWSLPEDPPTEAEWSELEYRTLRFPGHPQETTENSVDLSHLSYVHGYRSVSRVGSVLMDGAEFKRAFDFRRNRSIGGIAKIEFDVSAVVQV